MRLYLTTIILLAGCVFTYAIPQKDESLVPLLPLKADTVAFEVLMGVSSFGWDTSNQGILINWRRDNPDKINNSSGGDYDLRNQPTRHDAQNDIRALQHYYWFKRLHNQNDFFDEAIQRLEPTVRSKYSKMSSKKGWMYYVLLRLWEYGGDKAFWRNSILQWGNNVYADIDPELGIYYETNMANCDCGTSTIYLDKAYRVDHQLQAGAAMVDAGTRFNKPEWIEAGYRQVLTTYQQSFSEKYGLFGRIYLLGNSGYKKNAEGAVSNNYDYTSFQNKLWDSSAKTGEVSEEIDALIRAAMVTKRQDIKEKFLDIAEKMLTALKQESIHDKTYGGFYQMLYLANSGNGKKAGDLSNDFKELRQSSLLGTYYIANQIFENKWKDMEDEMLRVLTTENTLPAGKRGAYLPDTGQFPDVINGYRGSVAGYSFQVYPNWSIYRYSAVEENWVSNESNSLVLLGLYQYMTPIDDIPEIDDTNPLGENVLIDEDFSSWKKQGDVRDATIYSETRAYPHFSGTFKYKCSAVDPTASTRCDTRGRILINPADKTDSGWLLLPELPNVKSVRIFRDSREGAHMRLDRLKAGVEPTNANFSNKANWETMDTDNSDAATGCVDYTYNFSSETPVQLRITTTGVNSNVLSRVCVEGFPAPDKISHTKTEKVSYIRNGNLVIAGDGVVCLEAFSPSGNKIKNVSGNMLDLSELSQGVYLVKYTLADGISGVWKILK